MLCVNYNFISCHYHFPPTYAHEKQTLCFFPLTGNPSVPVSAIFKVFWGGGFELAVINNRRRIVSFRAAAAVISVREVQAQRSDRTVRLLTACRHRNGGCLKMCCLGRGGEIGMIQ